MSFFVGYELSFELLLVALPRIEFASATKGVVSLLAKASSQLIPKGNASLQIKLVHKFRDTVGCPFFVAENQPRELCFVALPQKEFASKPKAILLARVAVAKLISARKCISAN